MTTEQMRIAVAEACGWTVTNHGVFTLELNPSGQPESIPNFPASLDAMHEAEKVLTTEKQCADFAHHLAMLVKGFPYDPFLGPQSYIWHATAEQRAEAFLRTLNLWPAPSTGAGM